MTKQTALKVDVFQRVTDSIIAQLEKGVRPWQRPWAVKGTRGGGMLPLNAVSGRPYRGINVFLLWSDAITKGYASPYWLTYKQALGLGGNVKKGEKGSFIVYANRVEKPSKSDPSETDSVFFWKGFTVFNAEQCEGLPEKFYPAQPDENPDETEARKIARIGHADSYFAKVGATLKHGGGRAFYSPSGDFIQMPEIDAFKDAESYYATLGHEHVHWTGAKARLDRDFSGRFGDEAYAAEELVAELGSAFLCAQLGLTLEPREDHAAYLASWLKVLKGDKRFIVQAASKAQKAVDYLTEAAGEAQDAPEEGDGEEVAQAA